MGSLNPLHLVGGLLGMNGGPDVPPMPSLPRTPNVTAEDATAQAAAKTAAEAARKKARLAAGRASTLLTGSQGLTGAAPTERKTLLGR